MEKSNPKKETVQSCNVNFGKVADKSVKVFVGDKRHQGVEIIGGKGKYSVYTDPSNKELSNLRGTSGTLKEVKSKVSKFLCGTDVPKIDKSKKAVTETAA
jgi:hypothetical protein